MSKTRLSILRGGPSAENAVSMKTGRSLIETLKEKYTITDVIVDRQGKWFVNGIERTPMEVARHTDIFFNALHGEYGEDGKVQQILETLNIPFTGPKTLAAALSMNKHQAKDLFKQFGLKTPIHKVIYKDRPVDDIAFDLYKNFVMPVIIKPVNSGSSIGVSVARNLQSLQETLANLFSQYERLLVEEFIEGRQGTVVVIDDFRNEPCYACSPVEICLPNGVCFLDYDSKYNSERVDVAPGNFSQEEKELLTSMAKKAHAGLGLRHYSRSDFIVHPRRGVYILEINSLPDISRDSVFAKSLEPIGANYEDIVDHIINLALRNK